MGDMQREHTVVTGKRGRENGVKNVDVDVRALFKRHLK
jgi:hypothetical protein